MMLMRWLRDNAGWISVTVTLIGAGLGLFVRDAMATTDKRLSLIEERAEGDRRTRRLILQKLDALCRATPQANCPLGTE
jgi:hypothetical protein